MEDICTGKFTLAPGHAAHFPASMDACGGPYGEVHIFGLEPWREGAL